MALMKDNDNKGKDELNTLGKILILGLSTLLAGFMAKKLQERYPNGELNRFVKIVVISLGIFSAVIIVLMFISAIILSVYQAFTGHFP